MTPARLILFYALLTIGVVTCMLEGATHTWNIWGIGLGMEIANLVWFVAIPLFEIFAPKDSTR